MRIMTLNGWGGACGSRLVDYVAGADCDVVCLQEVTRSVDGAAGWLTYRDGDRTLEQRASLFDEIAAALPGHSGYFAPAAHGPLEDADGNAVASDWGLATFVRRTLPVIGQSQGFIHGRFRSDGWGEHPRARNAHGIRIHDHETGTSTAIVNVHGLRDPSGKHDTLARLDQAQRLAALVEGLAEEGDDIVVCGDFNVLPGSVTFVALGRLGMTDLVTGTGHGDTRTSLYDRDGRFADYMFVSSGLGLHGFEVVTEPEVSDHRPLILTTGGSRSDLRGGDA